MTESIIWWLTVELIGALAFPIGFLFFRFLPDRGYSFTKLLGLLVVTYLLWAGATAHVIPNARWSIALILVTMGAASAPLAWRARSDIAAYLRDRWQYVVVVEGLFAATLSLTLLYLSFAPGINPTQEAFVDFADINAILRSEYFPPNDPFLAGHSIPLYYFGHLVVAALTKLTGVDSEIGYSLGLAVFISVAAVGVFGLAYNLLAANARPKIALAVALVAPLFLLVMANIEGLFELIAIHGIGSTGFYRVLDINGLDGPRTSSEWYPTEYLWHYRAIILGGPAGDRQFPFFAIIDGFLHAHVMGIPFVLAGLAAALNLWRSPILLTSPIGGQWVLLAAGTGVVLGASAFVNIIDFPTIAAVMIAMLALRAWAQERRIAWQPFSRAAVMAVAILATALVLFLPYYQAFEPGASLRPMQAARQLAIGQELGLNITSPHHLIYTWLPFFWLTLALGAVVVARARLKRLSLALAVAPAVLVVVAWAVTVVGGSGWQAFLDDVDVRGWNWLTVAFLGSALALVLLSLIARLDRQSHDDHHGSVSFVLALSGIIFLMLFGMELFWIKGLPRANDRFWTALHINYQAWILLSLTSAFALYYLISAWRPQSLLPSAVRIAWLGASAVILAAAFVYPVIATFGLTQGFAGGPRSLSVLEGVKQFNPSEYEAIRWIQSNVDGAPVILEAVGDSYSASGRVSAYTGLPTLLGWHTWHETQWRNSTDFVEPRTAAVELVYTTNDPEKARAVLDQFDVEYVYVGALERERYEQIDLAKFGAFMEAVFQNEEVTIYKMRED